MKQDRNDPSRDVWECIGCGGINAHNIEDAEKAAGILKMEVAVSTGSCFDNICGHCGANVIPIDSPLMAECYSHINPNDEISTDTDTNPLRAPRRRKQQDPGHPG